MKKIITLSVMVIMICIYFSSCSYHKDEQIVTGFDSSESFYMVRVFGPALTNSGALKIYYLPMDSINDRKVDSINKEADKYIENCEKYTKN